MLELKNVSKVYNPGTVTETRLFESLCLKIDDGEFVSVVGSNGSGKTSLLNIICGSTPATSGDVLLDGKNLNGVKDFMRYAQIGRVYQNPALGTCPNLTIMENLSLAESKGGSYGLSKAVNKKREAFYRERLEFLELGLEDKLNVRMGALSGGQRQAVALLTATLTPIRFLILDEHTAALDPRTAETIMLLTDKIIKEKKLTAIMVTHNLRYAVEYGTRLIMLDKGRIIMDKSGEEKRTASADGIREAFNKIS